ncbi:2-phosphosulfolactate phosphatase [candidate division KSB1 bacterium]|nr:2-phosphosulfolactate phosphatase [candidate division KSB1 bacterium]
MEIRILHLIEGAKQARGLTVIIDVFRAFTTECYVIHNGANAIYPVGDIRIAYELKRQHQDYVLMGERGGIIQPGFDFGNSPAQIEDVDFTGKTVVHTTSAGTQGIANAVRADEVITGSFVNAAAVVRYIQQRNPRVVSLVAMGIAGVNESAEDTLMATYAKMLLEGAVPDDKVFIDRLRRSDGAQKFFDPGKSWAPERDFELCTSFNRFDFVLKAHIENGHTSVRRFDV